MSDLHLEFDQDGGKHFLGQIKNTSKIDVLILAGDITVAPLMIPTITNICDKFKNSEVLYILGNHDHAHSNQNELYDNMQKSMINNSNLTILENDIKIINNQRFLGCTLWYKSTPYSRLNQKYWYDFITIPYAKNYIYEANKRSVRFFEQNIQKNDIVISHMLPTRKSIHPKWSLSKDNCFYICELDKMIFERQPKLWIHGHTHEFFDYKFSENTKIICNPRGYLQEPNILFNSCKIIDI